MFSLQIICLFRNSKRCRVCNTVNAPVESAIECVFASFAYKPTVENVWNLIKCRVLNVARINFDTMPSAECCTLRPVAHILPLFSPNTVCSLNWQTIRKYPNYLPLIPNNSIKMLFETDFIAIFPGTRTNIKSHGTAFCITCNIEWNPFPYKGTCFTSISCVSLCLRSGYFPVLITPVFHSSHVLFINALHIRALILLAHALHAHSLRMLLVSHAQWTLLIEKCFRSLFHRKMIWNHVPFSHFITLYRTMIL